jgi:hypothetical protein
MCCVLAWWYGGDALEGVVHGGQLLKHLRLQGVGGVGGGVTGVLDASCCLPLKHCWLLDAQLQEMPSTS